MAHEVRDKNLLQKFKGLSSTPHFIPILFLLFLVITIPVITLISSRTIDVRQRAESPPPPTATMNLEPFSGNFSVGERFSVSLVIDGGGQAFNAAQADVSVSSNLTIESLVITPPESGGCNFTYVNMNKTPKISNLSFAGGILQGSSNNCRLYTVNFLANTTGTGTITFSKTSVKSYESHRDILRTYQNGSYILGFEPSATPTQIPTATLTPIPTSTLTPTPTTIEASPTPISVAPPIVNSYPANTYASSYVLEGSKESENLTILVNNSSAGVIYPTITSWQFTTPLTIGVNSFSIESVDGSTRSTPVNVTIARHKTADITGDNIVDLTDLSIFGSDWEKTSGFNNPMSDMNEDGIVDLTDFSILAKAYE